MKLAVLYSGGKDSTLSLMKAKNEHEIVCLITIISENKHSYMFHTPNIDITLLQSQALGLPLIRVRTKGEKEEELADLKNAIIEAKKRYNIDGIVTGAVKSVYQSSRIQKICDNLNLKCINPLWHMDELKVLQDLLENDMKVIISGVFAEPLDESYLGAEINQDMIAKLSKVKSSHHISPAGEGGEIETTVLDCPVFSKSIEILKSEKHFENYSGVFVILDARLVEK